MLAAAILYQDRAASPNLATLSKASLGLSHCSVHWIVGSSQQSRGCAVRQGVLYNNEHQQNLGVTIAESSISS